MPAPIPPQEAVDCVGYLNKAWTPYHSVLASCEELIAAGYKVNRTNLTAMECLFSFRHASFSPRRFRSRVPTIAEERAFWLEFDRFRSQLRPGRRAR